MIESQAHRTLVKSPPELWAEVSDPAALARHLGEIAAEIRITRVEPEHSVAWEGDRISGRVELAPSGWGTKVSLTLQAQAPQEGPPGVKSATMVPATPAPGAPAPTPSAPREVAKPAPGPTAAARGEVPHSAPVTPGPATVEADTVGLSPAEESSAEATSQAAPVTATEALGPAPSAPARAGIFARLIGRLTGRAPVQAERASPSSPSDEHPYSGIGRPSGPAAPASAAEAEPDPEPAVETAPAAKAEPEPQPEPPIAAEAGPTPAPATEVSAASPSPAESAALAAPGEPALDSERAAAALAAVLDSLGSAHHRPFSRS